MAKLFKAMKNESDKLKTVGRVLKVGKL